jgi:DNA repair/transcription protein MET18/MMS19
LSRGPESGLTTYLKPVVKECNEHLEDAPTKQSEASERMLFAIACTSWEACNYITAGVLPQLFVLYHSTKDMPKRRALMATLGKIIEASVQVFGEWIFSPYQQQNGEEMASVRYGIAENNALHKYTKQTLDILIEGLTSTPIENVSHRLALLSVSRQLIRVREGLSNADISRIIKILNDMIIVEQSYGKDEARIAAIWNLDEIAKQKPQLIIEQSFPAFLAKLPDTDVGYEDKYLPVLEAFARIGVENKIFGTVVVRLKNKLNAAIYQDASSEYIKAILSALLFSITNTTASLEGTDNTCPYYNDLVLPLITTVSASLKPHQQDDIVFGLMGKICNEILRRQSSAFQASTVEIVFRNADISAPDGLNSLTKEQSRHLLITSGLLAALRKDVTLPFDKTVLLIRFVSITKEDHLSAGARVAAIQIISLLVNKFLTIADMKTMIPPILNDLSKQPQSIPIVFAILKAQVFRNAPGLNSTFGALVSSLSDATAGSTIAHGFSSLLQPDEILTKQNHCVISPLHKQKTFAMLVPDISQGVRSVGSEAKKNHLVALSGILRWLPFAIIESEVSSLAPILLQTLDIAGEDDIKVGAIDQITSVLDNKGQALEEHVGSVITRLLNMSTTDKNPPRVRAKALQCLALVPARLRTEIVIPYRKQVIKRLTVALDDRRRAVRAEAVRCRMKWFEIDEGESADPDDDN